MSQMEYNRGLLIPTKIRYLDLTDEEYEDYLDDGYACIHGQMYEVAWENQGEDLDEIARAEVYENGVIAFETYHYNGGAHWTEVVEYALKRNKSE